MRIVFALRNLVFFRLFDGTIRELGAQGHTVEALFDPRPKRPGTPVKNSRAAVLACEAETPGFTWGWMLRRSDRLRRPLLIARELINYSSYFKPGRQISPFINERYQVWMPEYMQGFITKPAVRKLLATRGSQWALRQVEKVVPPYQPIVRWLEAHRPDVVVASPYIVWWSREIEYIKAAQALNIPTVAAVASWDNLTTKGVFQIIPDLTLVWNQVQVEAVRLHGVPAEKIVAAGAGVFDPWFELQPALDRAAYCRQVGLDPDQPYILYLCSSKSIVQDETTFVEEVARSLRENPATRHVQLLVRPHPLHRDIWRGFDSDLLTVWPREGLMPVTTDTRQDFFHALHFSAGVLGINTSALLEAAIADRPCLTILAERFRATQTDITHFQYLLNGGFLEVADDVPQASGLVAEIVGGRDAKRDERRRFVKDFLRPFGIDRPASQVMAAAIAGAARRRVADLPQTLALAHSRPAA